MINVETDYTLPALEAALECSYLLPASVVVKLRLCLSLIKSHGMATTEELSKQLGKTWCIARRTPANIERWGADCNFITNKQYDEAERKAIESR